MKEYDVALVEKNLETGELVLTLSNELLKELGWELDSTFTCKDNQDGTWTLSKKK